MGVLISLLIGAAAGWLAGKIMKGFGFGLIGNIVVGIAGFILPKVGISLGSSFIASVLHATFGAVILLFIIGLVRKGG